MKHSLIFSILLLFSTTAFSQFDESLFLDNFSQEDFDGISKEFGAAFSFTKNSGGDSLGKIWGVELGLIVGVTEAPRLQQKIEENDPSGEQQDLGYIPSGGIVAGLSMPFGIGLELNYIPEFDFEGFGISNTAIALRWEITEILPLIEELTPLKISMRVAYGSANFNYQDDTENADININNTEFTLLAGLSLPAFEPYLSLGHIQGSTDLSAESRSFLIPVEVAYDSEFVATKLSAGALFKLSILRLGVEYSYFDFGVNRLNLKLSFKF